MSTLSQQLAFILELDKLKRITRQTPVTGPDHRMENDAEHSWHAALMVSVFADYVPSDTDLARVVRMLLLHDVVEIDAGDTFAYDAAGYADKAEREQRAAKRIFGLLPEPQAGEFHALWEEFEAVETNEAHFANALDRLQPLLLNSETGGGSWASHQISRPQVLKRMEPVRRWLPTLWPQVLSILENAVAQGWIRA